MLVCLILVMLADFIHNIKKTGEELGNVSEHIVMFGLCMLFLIDCSVTMIQAHGWAFYEGVQVQQVREELHHSKIYLVWYNFFPERRVKVYSFNRDSLCGPNNEIAPFSFCYT